MVSLSQSEEIILTGSRIRLARKANGVLSFRLCRPERRNAFDDQLMREARDAFLQVTAMPAHEARVLLLEAEGDSFCAGADLESMRALADASASESAANAQLLSDMFATLSAVPCPVVGMVQGAAIGGGLGLVSCCDIVVASEKAFFATSEVLLGIVPAVISPYVVRKIGLAHSCRIMLTGERIGAVHALSMGLVSEVVSDITSLASAGESIVTKLLAASPAAQRRTKSLLQLVAPLPGEELRKHLQGEIAAARASAEGKAGLSAFLSKSKADWVPR